jgi:hypothetical protein
LSSGEAASPEMIQQFIRAFSPALKTRADEILNRFTKNYLQIVCHPENPAGKAFLMELAGKTGRKTDAKCAGGQDAYCNPQKNCAASG